MEQAKLLFIDDEQEILNAYANIFKKKNKLKSLSKFVDGDNKQEEENIELFWNKFNFEIEFASNGEEGVGKVEQAVKQKAPFQIAFVDMRMPPGINGAETAAKIRKIDSSIEIVIITAYSDLSINDINSMVGRPDKLIYIKKPFYNEEIRQIILNLTVKYKNERIKEDFISNVSHELRTPLASISGFAKLLLNGKNIKKDDRELVKIIQESSNLMERLVEELITSVQMQKNSLKVKPQKIDPFPVIKSVVKSFAPLFPKGDDVVLVDKVENLGLLVEWDEVRIKQAMANLLTNAKKFTKKGSVEISCAKTSNNKFEINIEDSGIGIPEEKIELVFDKFSRVEDGHHHIPGLGLGLSIVKEIVMKHKGEVEVKSKLDIGTTFTLRFAISTK